MKSRLLKVIILAGVFLSASFVNAESISNFDTEVRVNKDATINVVETIKYDAEGLSRHGIYRDIRSLAYDDVPLEISDISVTDEAGNLIKFTKEDQGHNLRLKIGDSYSTFSGEKTYIIKYRVENAIGYSESNDEIYWNMTGNSWTFPINSVSGRIILPEGVSAVNNFCYLGSYGSKDNCNDFMFLGSATESIVGSIMGNITAVRIENFSDINTGYTLAVDFPKGVVIKIERPEKYKGFSGALSNAGIFDIQPIFLVFLLLPLFVFFIYFKKWSKEGKDPKMPSVIVVEYDVPYSLNPLQVAGIMNEIASPKDLSADIIYLATKGVLRIKKLPEKDGLFSKLLSGGPDYEFTKRSLGDRGNYLTSEAEKSFMDRLFGMSNSVSISDLKKKKMFSVFNDINKKTASELKENDFYSNDYWKYKKGWFQPIIIIIYLAIFFAGFLPAIFTYLYSSIGINSTTGTFGIVLAVLLTMIIVSVFRKIMPAKTIKGVDAKAKILGLKEYIRVAEKDRIAFHNAPEKTPEQFEKLLPFAMVFGLEEKWAEEFEGIYNSSDATWYEGDNGSVFSAIYFTHAMSGLSDSFMNATRPQASHGSGGFGGGGGGFSGGGGGGGGGGSW